MGWDGSGGYTRERNFSADASAGIRILASAMDQELNDVASAMQLCLARDGQNTPTADIPLGGNRLVNGGQPASATDYIRVKEVIENVPIFMEDEAASAAAISVSSQFFTGVSATQAPADGVEIKVRMIADKATCALYLDGFSANIQHQDGNRANEALVSGGVYDFIYSSADTAWKVTSPDNGITAAERAAGITPTNYQYEPGDIRRYGAVNDGTTDSTTSIQTALDISHLHPTYIPGGGEYRITSALTMPNQNGCMVYGDGERSLIRQATAAADGIGWDGTTRTFNNTFRNFTISPTGNIECGIAFNLKNVSDSYFINVNVRASNSNQGFKFGFSVFTEASGGAYRNYFYYCNVRCYPDVTGIAITFSGASAESCNSNRVIGGSIQCDTGKGIVIAYNGGGSNGASDQNVISHCTFEGSTDQAVEIRGFATKQQYNMVVWCRFEGVTNGILMDSNSEYNMCMGNSYTTGITLPVSDLGSTNVVFEMSPHSALDSVFKVGKGHLKVTGIQDTAAAAFGAILASTAHPAFGAQVTGDTDLRLEIRADGQIEWGPGDAASDVALDRVATNELDFNDGQMRKMTLTDGITAPTAVVGQAFIYVDTADGDLKVRFGDGTTATIAVDT